MLQDEQSKGNSLDAVAGLLGPTAEGVDRLLWEEDRQTTRKVRRIATTCQLFSLLRGHSKRPSSIALQR